MEFSNLLFLYILFPAVVLIYFLLPDMRRKNLALLVISLVFYAMGQPIYLLLMLALCYVWQNRRQLFNYKNAILLIALFVITLFFVFIALIITFFAFSMAAIS